MDADNPSLEHLCVTPSARSPRRWRVPPGKNAKSKIVCYRENEQLKDVKKRSMSLVSSLSFCLDRLSGTAFLPSLPLSHVASSQPALGKNVLVAIY